MEDNLFEYSEEEQWSDSVNNSEEVSYLRAQAEELVPTIKKSKAKATASAVG